MVEVFKSPINLQNAAAAAVAAPQHATSDAINIDANSSARVTLAFARAFDVVPVVLYSVICADNAFCLAHYIAEVTPTGVTICIENQAFTARTIKITYSARSA